MLFPEFSLNLQTKTSDDGHRKDCCCLRNSGMKETLKDIFAYGVAMTVALFLLTSCLGDDEDDIVYTHHAGITSFTLGTLNNYVSVTSSTGGDSLVMTTVTGTDYKFFIDQLKHEIYNPDSLPYGTDVEHVICTIGSRNSGTILIKNIDSDTLSYYSSKDSIDFSKPRTFIAYSNAGSDNIAYTITVNVHQEKPDDFHWTLMGENASLPPFNTEAYGRVVPFGNRMIILDGGNLMETDDWSAWPQWNTLCPAGAITQLLGTSGHRLYAFNASGDLVASDGSYDDWASGITWKDENVEDANAGYMPDTEVHVVGVPSKTNPDTYQLVLVGRNSRMDTSDNLVVWGKVEENGVYSEESSWFYYPQSVINKYPLPALNNLQLVAYDDGILAFGTTDEGELSPLYFSRDHGITWPETTLLSLPEDFAPEGLAYAMTVDSNNCLWLADGTTGKVWRGRLNRLGWTDIKRAFTD